MRRFLAGLVLGLVLGGSAAAIAAELLKSGPLTGWVVLQTGNLVCADPYIEPDNQEIQCD